MTVAELRSALAAVEDQGARVVIYDSEWQGYSEAEGVQIVRRTHEGADKGDVEII